jgi:hypothetical protein
MEAPPRSRSSLDSPTKLDRARVPNVVESKWLLNLYPDAAEAGGCLQSPARPWDGRERFERGEDRSTTEAVRRARGHVRRYCAANWLNRLGTLTYADACHDPIQLRADLAAFFRKLRSSVGSRFPYLWVPEWHPGGHGLHVHFTVGQFVHWRTIKAAWGRGIIDIRMLTDLPVGSGALGEARLAARYLSKYVGKDLGATGTGGLHRYEVAQGFGPKVRRLTAPTLQAVMDRAIEIMGAEPADVWDSEDQPDWDGPHAVWASWA